MPADVEVRPARPEEYEAAGDITVAAYSAVEGFSPGARYEAELRDVAGRVETAEVMVAAAADGRLLGAVTFVPGPGPLAEFDGPDESGMRMLAVDPAAQGRGIGRLLAQACVDRARAIGRSRLVLHTTGAMTAAHELYRSLGFARTPELDITTPGGMRLEAYVRDLAVQALAVWSAIAAASACQSARSTPCPASSRSRSRAPGIACASASPCAGGNIGSAVPWTTSVGAEMAETGRLGPAPSMSSWFPMEA